MKPLPRPADSPYRNEDEAASYLRLRATTLRDMRIKGTGPRYRKHGDRVVYDVADLTKWTPSFSPWLVELKARIAQVL